MWSHYAKSHTGFCVEYNLRNPFVMASRKVNYTNSYPQLTYPFEATDIFSLALNKSTDWVYEDEFRSVINTEYDYPGFTDNEFVNLQADQVASLCLGAKMNQANKRAFLSIIKQSDFEPEVFQAKLSENSFKLVFEKIKY